MSLKAEYKPFENFLTQGRRFIDSPGAISGMDFDDAVVTYKRYVISQLHDEPLSIKLNALGKAVRNQEVDAAVALFEEVIADRPNGE